jgi:hypothetical protein
MAEKQQQLTFALSEVAAALMRAEGITEGKWLLGFEFEFGAGNMGPSPAEVKPSGIVSIKSVVLSRQPDDAPDFKIVVDAATLKASSARADTSAKRPPPKA